VKIRGKKKGDERSRKSARNGFYLIPGIKRKNSGDDINEKTCFRLQEIGTSPEKLCKSGKFAEVGPHHNLCNSPLENSAGPFTPGKKMGQMSGARWTRLLRESEEET